MEVVDSHRHTILELKFRPEYRQRWRLNKDQFLRGHRTSTSRRFLIIQVLLISSIIKTLAETALDHHLNRQLLHLPRFNLLSYECNDFGGENKHLTIAIVAYR